MSNKQQLLKDFVSQQIQNSKQQTQPIVNSDGFKNGEPPAGSNWRIPGDTLYNPTPYPIQAVSDNGITKTLNPFDESTVEFPGAKYVDEYQMKFGGLPKYQIKGEVVPTRYPVIRVTDPNDPKYLEYQKLKRLNEWSNIQDTDFKNFLADYYLGDEDSYYLGNISDSKEIFKTLNDIDPYIFRGDDPRDRNLYFTEDTGPYGSKKEVKNFKTKQELNKFLASRDKGRFDVPQSNRLFYGNTLEPFVKKYNPIGYQYVNEFNYPSTMFAYGLANEKWVAPDNQFIEDEINRDLVKEIYPTYTDKEIDDVVIRNRNYPYYVTNYITDDGYSGIFPVRKEHQVEHLVSTNQLPKVLKSVDDDWDIPAGIKGYLPESIQESIESSYGYYPIFGTPESYLGNTYEYDALPYIPMRETKLPISTPQLKLTGVNNYMSPVTGMEPLYIELTDADYAKVPANLRMDVEQPMEGQRGLRNKARYGYRDKDGTVYYEKGVPGTPGYQGKFSGKPLTSKYHFVDELYPKTEGLDLVSRKNGGLAKYQGDTGPSEVKEQIKEGDVSPVLEVKGERPGLWERFTNSYFNPENWGKDDVSDKYANYEQARLGERKLGNTNFMWNNKRYTTKFPELTPEEQFAQTGITDTQLFDKTYIEKSALENLTPYGYDNPYGRGLQLLFNIKPQSRLLFDYNVQEGDKAHQNRKDAFNLFMGKPQEYDTFSISKVKPTINSNDDPDWDFANDTDYFALNAFSDPETQKELIDTYNKKIATIDSLLNTYGITPQQYKLLKKDADKKLKNEELRAYLQEQGINISNAVANDQLRKDFNDLIYTDYNPENKSLSLTDNIAGVMGHYTLAPGVDENGKKYISYYDKWDLAGPASVVPFGKKYNIYDRMYYQDAGLVATSPYERIPKSWKEKYDWTPNVEEEYIRFKNDPNAPDNLRFTDDLNDYNVRGMWDSLERPVSWEQALTLYKDLNGEEWVPEEDGYYHAWSQHPGTGEWLKPKHHSTAWMNFAGYPMDPYSRVVVNPEGFFGDETLQTEYKKDGGLTKYQKGRQVVYTDPEEFKIANQAYRDSSDAYNLTQNAINFIKNADIKNRADHYRVRDTPPVDVPLSYKSVYPTKWEVVKPKSAFSSALRFMIAGYKKPETKPVLQEAPVYIEPKPLAKLPVSEPTLVPYDLPAIKENQTTPIMQASYAHRNGQYQIGENVWNEDKKKWERRMFKDEEADWYRNNGKIKKDGGLTKYQSKGQVKEELKKSIQSQEAANQFDNPSYGNTNIGGPTVTNSQGQTLQFNPKTRQYEVVQVAVAPRNFSGKSNRSAKALTFSDLSEKQKQEYVTNQGLIYDPQLKGTVSIEALKSQDPERLAQLYMQEFVDQQNKGSLQKKLGKIDLSNPTTRNAALEYAKFKMTGEQPGTAFDQMMNGNKPSFYRPNDASQVFGAVGALPAIGLGALGATAIPGAVSAIGSSMNAPLTIGSYSLPGATMLNTVGALGAGYGLTKTPDTARSIANAYNNPTLENIGQASLETGLNLLDFAGTGVYPAFGRGLKSGVQYAKGVDYSKMLPSNMSDAAKKELVSRMLARQMNKTNLPTPKYLQTLAPRIDPIGRSSVNVANDILKTYGKEAYDNAIDDLYKTYGNAYDAPMIEFKSSRPASFIRGVGAETNWDEGMLLKERFCEPGSECAKTSNAVTNAVFTDITGKPFDALGNAHNAWHLEDQMTRHGGRNVTNQVLQNNEFKIGDRILMGNGVDQSTYAPGYYADPEVRHAGFFAGYMPTENGIVPMILESGAGNPLFLNPVAHTITGPGSLRQVVRPNQFLGDSFAKALVDKNIRYAFRDKPSVATYSSENETVQSLLNQGEQYREQIKRTHDLTNDEFDEMLNSLIGIGAQETKLNAQLPSSFLPSAKVKLQNALVDAGLTAPIKQTINAAKRIGNAITSKASSLPEYPGTSYIEMESAKLAEAEGIPFSQALQKVKSQYQPKPRFIQSTVEPSKGMFRQKFQTESARTSGANKNITQDELANGLAQMAENYQKIKKLYPEASQRDLINLTTLMWNSPGKAQNKELVDFYLFGKGNPDVSKFKFDYLDKVNKRRDELINIRPQSVEPVYREFLRKGYPEIQYQKGGLTKFVNGGPKEKGWREYKTATGQSFYLDPRFKDQRYYVDEKGNTFQPNQNSMIYDVASNSWESPTLESTLEVRPRYRYEKRPGALGSFETVRIDDDNNTSEIISPNPMETRREQEAFLNSINPFNSAALAFQGVSNMAQGNIAEGALQTALSIPVVGQVLGKAVTAPLKFAGREIAQTYGPALSEVGRLATTKTPLKNTWKLNPYRNRLDQYNRVVGRDAIDDALESRVIRSGSGEGLSQRPTAYPSFTNGLPNQTYIDQVINMGETPYIISTNRPMGVSTLGRHGKGTTHFPIGEDYVHGSRQYLSSFPIEETQLYNAQPHWLKGYQKVWNNPTTDLDFSKLHVYNETLPDGRIVRMLGNTSGKPIGQDISSGGAFNDGVYTLTNFPDYVIKAENAALMETMIPGYKGFNISEMQSGLNSPNISKVIKSHPSNDISYQLMRRLSGTPTPDVDPKTLMNISDDAYRQLWRDAKHVRDNNLAIDFAGDNIMYDNATGTFKLLDISPTIEGSEWNSITGGGLEPGMSKGLSAQFLQDALAEKLRLSYARSLKSNGSSPGIRSVLNDEFEKQTVPRIKKIFTDEGPYKEGGSVLKSFVMSQLQTNR